VSSLTDPPAPADLAAALQALALRLPRLVERNLGMSTLPRSELEVLVLVVDGSGPSVSDVARELGLQTSNVSTTVHQLVERGLVERIANPEDRRSNQLVPTPRALAEKAAITAAWAGLIDQFLAGLPTVDRDVLVAAAPMLAALARTRPGRSA
jgi:DNA-binding MarR family transcriptional regulator